MEKNSGKQVIALIVLGLLTAFGLAVEIIAGIRFSVYYTSGAYLNLAAYAAMSVLLLYYAVAGYKVPHGNLMKYLFLVFAACSLCGVLSVVTERTSADTVYNTLRGVVVLLTAYVAGRLDRFKQNVVWMSVIGVLMLASSLILLLPNPGTDPFGWFTCFSFFLLWVDLMFAYVFRYREHKEAGLTDKN